MAFIIGPSAEAILGALVAIAVTVFESFIIFDAAENAREASASAAAIFAIAAWY